MFLLRLLRRFLRWLKEMRYEEKIALLRIAVIFTGCSYLICLLYASVPANEWLWGRAVTIFFQCLIAVSIPAALAAWLGNVLPSMWFLKTLKKGVAASPLLSQLQFHSAESVLHFARLHKLSLFRVSEELRATTAENVECRLEPLFLAPGYPPGLREKYYQKNLLWFDEEQVKTVQKTIAEGAIAVASELIRSITDGEKDKIIAEKDNVIEMLRAEVESLQEKLSKKNRGDGPYKTSARTRLFYIAELYAALVVMGILLTRWFETEEQKRKEYKIININTEFEAILSHNEELRTLLQKIKPDANLKKFQENTINLLRIAMPMGTVTFGGQKAPSMENIFKEIMTDRDAADFADQKKAADEEVGDTIKSGDDNVQEEAQ